MSQLSILERIDLEKKRKAELILIKKIAREYPPGTKFRSLFGKTGIVSDKDDFFINDDGDAFILVNGGEFLMIYNGKYWADIL